MKEITFRPSPGFLLIDPIPEETIGLTKRKDLRKGIVVATGGETMSEYNEKVIYCPCVIGDTIQRAARYEGDVFLGNKRYEIVRFQDVQGVYAK